MGRSKRKVGSDDHDAQSKITKQKYAAHYQAAWTTGPEFTTWILIVCYTSLHLIYFISSILLPL